MRLPRVAASVVLTAALALIVVPGTVGSRTPRPDPPIDARLLRPVELALPSDGTAMAAPTLDPAHRSRGALDTGDRLVEPAPALAAPERIDAVSPDAPVGVVVVPPPTPKPTPRPPSRPADTAGGGSGGGSGGSGGSTVAAAPAPADAGGGWNYDGHVSWYGPGFYGNTTACGHTYTSSIMGVAHKSLPCGTSVTFRNPANGRVITVPVIDRGPYVAGRNWDLSAAACAALDHCYTGPLQWR